MKARKTKQPVAGSGRLFTPEDYAYIGRMMADAYEHARGRQETMKRPVITYIVTYGSPGVSSQSTARGVRALGELVAYLVESGRQIKSVEQKKP